MLQVSSRKKQRAQETVPVLLTIIRVQKEESCCIPTPIANVTNHFRMEFHPYSIGSPKTRLIIPKWRLGLSTCLAQVNSALERSFFSNIQLPSLAAVSILTETSVMTSHGSLWKPHFGQCYLWVGQTVNQSSHRCLHAHQLHILVEINGNSKSFVWAHDPFSIICLVNQVTKSIFEAFDNTHIILERSFSDYSVQSANLQVWKLVYEGSKGSILSVTLAIRFVVNLL